MNRSRSGRGSSWRCCAQLLIAFGGTLATTWSCSADEQPEEICQDLALRADRERDEALARASRVCSSDDGCTIVAHGLQCVDDCDAISAVAVGAKASLEADVSRIDVLVCGDFLERGCRNLEKCGPPISLPAAVCRAGRCEVELRPIE